MMTEPGTILVVDDTPDALKLLTEILTERGYRVRPANSGELALASIARNPPELILLDICMPGMDGFEVCRRLKSSENTSEIPVIFISALLELEDRVEGFRLGAVDFVTKPFQREELLARVKAHLDLKRLNNSLRQKTEELREINERLLAEISVRKLVECELATKVEELEESLARIKHLEGIIPICMYCKKILQDKDTWTQVEIYITKHSDALFSHVVCPECREKYKNGFNDSMKK